MTRNLIVLGCAALLAIGLSFGSFAGSVPDADSDGVPDQFDNCVTLANGPLASTGLCDGQEDNDQDGYGDPCDHDPNQVGGCGGACLAQAINEAFAVGTDPKYDLNCNGSTDPQDLNNFINRSIDVAPPGPTGLACAGTPPCSAP